MQLPIYKCIKRIKYLPQAPRKKSSSNTKTEGTPKDSLLTENLPACQGDCLSFVKFSPSLDLLTLVHKNPGSLYPAENN